MSETPKTDKAEVARECGVTNASDARSIAMGYADKNGMHTDMDNRRLATKEQMQCINNDGKGKFEAAYDRLKGKLCENFGVACGDGTGVASRVSQEVDAYQRERARLHQEQVDRVAEGGGPARETVRGAQVAEVVDNGGNPNGRQVGGPAAAAPPM